MSSSFLVRAWTLEKNREHSCLKSKLEFSHHTFPSPGSTWAWVKRRCVYLDEKLPFDFEVTGLLKELERSFLESLWDLPRYFQGVGKQDLIGGA